MSESHERESADGRPYAASAKSTGGGGFNHEDEVEAYYLAQMLIGAIPFGPESGIITKVNFQTRVDGWLLDDLLLTLSGGDRTHRYALSIKSNRQFEADHAAPIGFVRDCWEQLLNAGPMDPTGDYLALAVCGVPAAIMDDFDTLRGLADASEPGTLESRLQTRGFVDAGKRRMAASFACPTNVAAKYPEAAVLDAAHVLGRVLVIEFDFPSASSQKRREALDLCAQALQSPSAPAAAALWTNLCAIARDFRPKAGMLDRPRLIARLRARHDLVGYPNHKVDLEQLARYTDSQLSESNRWTLAGRLSLLRLSLRQKLDDAVQASPSTVDTSAISILIGRSGDGKSVVARQWLSGGSPQVWLDARLFECAPGENAMSNAEEHLRLKHPLPELLQSASGKRPRLVVDGVGRLFNELPLNAVARLAWSAADTGWEVIATCQDDDWDRVASIFQANKLRASVVQVDPLTDAELSAVAAAEPSLQPLIAKTDMHRVLARPKYLDVVLRGVAANSMGAYCESDQWTGEAHVAEWCWRSVIEGSPPRIVRSAATKQMASIQADAVRDSIAEDEMDAAHLTAIDSLIADGVCRKVGERLIFDHDLIGDWGRQRVLLAQASITVFIKSHSRGTSPMWLRALRLWALDILERQNDYVKWIDAVRQLAAAGEVAASDRVLEAVVLSAGAFEHLDTVWSVLRDEAELLRRLLERFLRSGTVPNPAAMKLAANLANQATEDLTARTAAECRIPNVDFWPALLVVLHQHRDEVARLAPGEVARVTRLWLLHTVTNMPFRKEAAEIALATGRYVWRVLDYRNSRHISSGGLDEWSLCNDAESNVYAAALTAAPVLPDAAADFALTAAGRREAPEVDDLQEPGVVYLAPWPDGPTHRVSEQFRNTVLRPEIFLLLAASRPDAAKEVLLAVLIDSPRLLKHPGMLTVNEDEDRELSVENIFGWLPAFYTRGPFLAFLDIAPEVAIDAIIRLVNFATDRWLDQEARDVQRFRRKAQSPRSVRVSISGDGGTVEWKGNADVYSWHLGDPRAPTPVTCALMALERWLYNRLANGVSIAAELDSLKSGARSVAFAGLLVAVARFRPPLLKDSLAFLIGVPEFLYWDTDAAVKHNIINTSAFAWQLRPVPEPHLIEQARIWHEMPHRKQNIFALAQFLFLNDADVRKLQSDRLPQWKTRLEGELCPEQACAIKACVRAFDISRWQVVDFPNGRKGWHQQQTAEEAKESETASKEANDAMREISFPYRCRELLDRPDLMGSDDLDRFWADLHDVAECIQNLPKTSGESAMPTGSLINERLEIDNAAMDRRRILNATMGGIAVLLLRYPTYLNASRLRKAWVLRQLRRIPRIRLPESTLDSYHPDETDATRWECFFAEIVVDFLRRKPRSVVWRLYAAELATGFHHSPVHHLFSAAFRCRAELNGGFEELCHLLLRWSAARWHANFARSGLPTNVDVRSEWHGAISDFLAGRLTHPLPSLSELAASPRELPSKPLPPERYRKGLDLWLIAAAFHNIMRPSEASNDQERAGWLALWHELLTWRLSLTARKSEQPVSGTPSIDIDSRDRWPRNKLPEKSDLWLLDRIADVVLHLGPREDHQLFWQPILALVPLLQPWAEHFLTSFFLNGLSIEHTPPTFYSAWKAMLDYASNSTGWTKADDAWSHLLGFDYLLPDYWERRHAPLLRLAQPYLEMYVKKKMRRGRKIRELFDLLKTPAAEEIRLSLLVIFADAVKEHPDLLSDRLDTPAAAKFLDFCLQNHRSTIAGNSEIFSAFIQILGTLVSMQEPLAFELQDQLRRS
jgi:hypothetical protein